MGLTSLLIHGSTLDLYSSSEETRSTASTASTTGAAAPGAMSPCPRLPDFFLTGN
jgi:hypothetical protein